ncbi:hypothetical protein BJ944DRAFT_183495 [Cunninghamella echinulata]|nr:hypothetical protein BJ944DRAFT_183495 [Cunninghamella echinulata]
MTDTTDLIDKRIYIGGLPPDVTIDQLSDRFGKFGSVSNISIAKDGEGQCRGFGHLNIQTSLKKWTSCLSVYNGSRWKGQVIRIEDSKPDYIEKLEKEKEELVLKAEKKRKREERWNNSDGFHAKDMSLITDNNVNTTTGKWKRGRYGRAIAVMRLRKADGTKFVFDPTSYKNNLEKLYNIGVRMKDSKQLPMFYEEYNDSKKYDNDDDVDYDFFDQKEPSHLDKDNDIQNNSNYTNVTNNTSTESSNTVEKVVENKGEERRLAAMERRIQEKEAKMELLNQVGKGKHVTFDNDDDNDDNDELNNTVLLRDGIDDGDNGDDKDDENDLIIKQSQQPKDGTKWMFDSDEDDDDDLNIQINPVLEGEKGRKRLELQSTFKGDDRFKLTEAFMDEDEDDDDNDIQSKQNQVVSDDITKSLDEEKDQSMNVLRAMFGDVKVMTQTKPSNDWSIGARYDPEAEDANNYIIQPKNNELLNKQEDDLMNDDSDDHDRYSGSEDNENEDMPIIKRTETEMPIVSTDKHFSVNVNLKPLFGAEEEPFKLFGGDNSEDDDDKPTTPKRSLEDEYTSFIPKHTEAQVGLGLMFFLHNDDPQLIKKSCYSYDANGIFQRNENDGYIEEWKKNRSIIADVLKARLKNSTRQKKSNVKK